MTAEINALYKKGMKEFVKNNNIFRYIDTDARDLSKKEGEAYVIRVRESVAGNLPDPSNDKLLISVLKYKNGDTNSATNQGIILPRNIMDLITETYKR